MAAHIRPAVVGDDEDIHCNVHALRDADHALIRRSDLCGPSQGGKRRWPSLRGIGAPASCCGLSTTLRPADTHEFGRKVSNTEAMNKSKASDMVVFLGPVVAAFGVVVGGKTAARA